MSRLNGTYAKCTYLGKTLLDAVTETTTSDAVNVAGAKRVTFAFTRANHSAGSSTFTVEGTLDSVTWKTLNLLVTNAANDNTETKARAASVVLSDNGTELAALDLEHFGFTEIRVAVAEGTDGTHTAKALIEY